MSLKGTLSSLTVGDVKSQIVSGIIVLNIIFVTIWFPRHFDIPLNYNKDYDGFKSLFSPENIFSERNEDFGLKIEGKRKFLILDDLSVTLESLAIVDGTMFTVDFQGSYSPAVIYYCNLKYMNLYNPTLNKWIENDMNLGGIRAGILEPKEIIEEDLFMIPLEEKKKIKRKVKESTELPKKRKSLPVAVSGSFGVDSKMTVQELASYFMDSEVGPQGAKEIGSFLFNQFTTAARLDALKSGKIVIESSDSSSSCDGNDAIDSHINSTQSDSASHGNSSSSSSVDSNSISNSNYNNSRGSKLSITFHSNAGKIYEETCNALNEAIIGELVLEGICYDYDIPTLFNLWR